MADRGDVKSGESSSDEVVITRERRITGLEGTDDYIGKVVGCHQSDVSDSDIEIIDVNLKNPGRKRKGDSVLHHSSDLNSSDDGVASYERFKNRKKIQRRKTAETKKRLALKAKETIERGKKAKKAGHEKREKVWRDESDVEALDDTIPEYITERRREFDQRQQSLHEDGLRLPPRYDDIEFSDDERLEELQERPRLSSAVEASRPYEDVELPLSAGVIPASIAKYLRPYQVEGVAFLHELFVYQRGGVLGDDMGLGKTVQVAAFLVAAFGKTGDERDLKRMRKMRRTGPPSQVWYPRVLIVCPSSLVDNWKNELDRWGYWHIDVFHGSGKEAVLDTAESGRLEIVITTYGTYRTGKDQLNVIDWDCVVADECHTIKERTSAITQSMNEINALCRIGLTGTAIQNKYEELWTLLNWTNPGRFGPMSTWESSICKPLRIGQSHDATVYQLKQARLTAKKLVQNLLPQFFLRRMKSLIAHQLPKKTDRVVFCQLTDTQQRAYELFLESPWVETVRNSAEMCDCDSGKKQGWCCNAKLPDGTKWQVMVFPLITTLQKLSNHLALLIPNAADHSDKQQRALDFLEEMVPDRWQELYANRDSLKNLANPDFCGKWNILKKLLKFWHANGDKVLIFSHSVRLLRMLELLFKNTSYNVSFLSGEIPGHERQAIVDDFNTDPSRFVFLISTKAGGVGLNITSANKVVIFDPNWNPSYDLQAQDRAYRIGQLRDVEVFRLVSAGTVEEVVYARQIYKQQQANIGYNASTERRYFKGVQKNKDQKGEIFGLQNLLTFNKDNIFLRDIVNKTNIAEAKQGIRILEMDMEDALNDEDDPLRVEDDKGDGAMSQLAALLTEGEDMIVKKKPKKQRTDAVLAILASAGVEYSHENSEVIGSSRVEAHLSRQAEETGNDVGVGEARLFAESQGPNTGGLDYLFRPPRNVMIRQFCTMAKTFGFASATEFALVVEGWTQKQRTDCLERFYIKRKELLLEIDRKTEAENMEDIEADGGRSEEESVNSVVSVVKKIEAGIEGSEEDEEDDEL